MVSAAGVEVPCNSLRFTNTCVAVFPSVPGCGTVLKAVDADGNDGAAERIVLRAAARRDLSDAQPTRTGSSRQQNSTFARTPDVRANG